MKAAKLCHGDVQIYTWLAIGPKDVKWYFPIFYALKIYYVALLTFCLQIFQLSESKAYRTQVIKQFNDLKQLSWSRSVRTLDFSFLKAATDVLFNVKG